MRSNEEIQERLNMLSELAKSFREEKETLKRAGQHLDALTSENLEHLLAVQFDTILWVRVDIDLTPSQILKARTS
jgi:hypothetical protein